MSILTAIKDTFNKIIGKDTKRMIDWNEQDETSLVGMCNTQFGNSADRKSGYEKQWFMNIAFVLSHQWVSWNDVTKKFDEPKSPPWRVKLSVNKILPRYRKALSKLSASDPKAVVTPNTPSEIVDIDSAALGTKILRGLKDKLKLKSVMHTKTQWQLLCGSAIIHYFWNSSIGKPIEFKKTVENQVTNEETGETETRQEEVIETYMTGDVEVEAISPYDVFPLDGATSMTNCRRMGIVKYVAVDSLKRLYPDKADKITAEKDDTMPGMFRQKIEGLTSTTTQSGYSINDSSEEEKVLLKRIWERPSIDFPKGVFIAYSNHTILEKGEIPDIKLGEEFEMPFLKYDDLEVPGRFWGQATIEPMIPVQKELNKGRSQVIENRNMMNKPKVLAVKGTLGKNSWTSETGEVVEWDPTVPGAQMPQVVSPASLPNYTFQLDTALNRDLADIGAMHEASQGEMPAGGRSGRALKELKSSDEDEYGSIGLQDRGNRMVLYSAVLKLVQEHYNERRMLKVVGDDKTAETISFLGADLKNNTDVWIEDTDFLPSTREGRQSFIMELYNIGMLGNKENDETRKRAMRMMESGTTDELWEESSADAKQAKSENGQMNNGRQVKTNWYDVHTTHIPIHTKSLKSPLVMENPRIYQLLEQHTLSHLRWLKPSVTPPAMAEAGNVEMPPPQPAGVGV